METREEFKRKMTQFAKRPGMYVGKNRLDYIQCFCNGWFYAMPDMFQWYSDYDMQRWLFMQESVSIAHAASINGWSLFERCYGIGQNAVEMFQEMIKHIPYSSVLEADWGDTVSSHINQIYSLYHWKSSRCSDCKTAISKYYHPVHQSIRDIIGEVTSNYESIIPFVRRMIPEPTDEFQIYIHYERYFLQVRFLYYSPTHGWIENTSLRDGKQYYFDLVILHAYCALVQKEEHKNHIIMLNIRQGNIETEVNEVDDIWYRIFNKNEDISSCNLNPFQNSYMVWRETVI